MKNKLIVGSVLGLVAVALVAPTTFAQKVETKNKTAIGVIQEINLKEKTISVKVEEGSAQGKDRTIDVPSSTKIEKDNKINQRLKDLKTGDKINIMYKQGKELGPDHKTQVEVMKALKITVLASGEATDAKSVTK